MRPWLAPLVLTAALSPVADACAQTTGESAGGAPSATTEAPAPTQSQVLTLDQERLFSDSAWGRRVQAEVEKASLDLAAENRKIEGDLSNEEKALTDRRAGMTPEAFRAEADAFDSRVSAIRKAQDAKARRITRLREVERQNFFGAVIPIMGEVMQARGAVAILDARAIFLSINAIDVTQEMVRRIDAAVGEGTPADPAAIEPDDAEEGTGPAVAAPQPTP